MLHKHVPCKIYKGWAANLDEDIEEASDDLSSDGSDDSSESDEVESVMPA